MYTVITPGRSGSTFVTDLILKNTGVNVYEWFSPYSYNTCLERKDTSSKDEYLGYVYSVARGEQREYGIKITPDICSVDYWGRDVLKDPMFGRSFGEKFSIVALMRLSLSDAVKSNIYSAITDEWHQGAANARISLGSSHFKLSLNDVIGRYAEIIDSEIKIFQWVVTTFNAVPLFFYEELYHDKEKFSKELLKHLEIAPVSALQKSIPDNKLMNKNHQLLSLISDVVSQAEKDDYIRELILARARIYKEIGLFSMHHSLYT
jgi:hypothetical protein